MPHLECGDESKPATSAVQAIHSSFSNTSVYIKRVKRHKPKASGNHYETITATGPKVSAQESPLLSHNSLGGPSGRGPCLGETVFCPERALFYTHKAKPSFVPVKGPLFALSVLRYTFHRLQLSIKAHDPLSSRFHLVRPIKQQ